jgi:SAM-dependent methyltransferase
MRDQVQAFIAIASRAFACSGPIYQLGVHSDGNDDDLGVLFAGQSMVRVAQRYGPFVDRVEDLANLTIDDRSAGAVLALETLESTFDVMRVMDEAYRILAPGGLFFAATLLEVEACRPCDYWRLTPNCLTRLMSPFKAWLVGWHGPTERPHTAYVVGCKSPMTARFADDCQYFMKTFNEWTSAEESMLPWPTRIRRRLRQWIVDGGRGDRHTHADFALHLPDRASWTHQWVDAATRKTKAA